MTGKAQGKKKSCGTKGTPIKKKSPTRAEERTRKNKVMFFERYLKTGNIMECCRQINVGRQTFYNWMKNDSVFKRDFEDAEDSLLDFAEGKLMNLIDEKSVPAILFMLKCKGKERGWIEPTYLDVRGGLKHAHTHTLSLKEMKNSYDRLANQNKK